MARISNWDRIFDFNTTLLWKFRTGMTNYVIVTETPDGWQVLSSKEGKIGLTELRKPALDTAYKYMKMHPNG